MPLYLEVLCEPKKGNAKQHIPEGTASLNTSVNFLLNLIFFSFNCNQVGSGKVPDELETAA